MRVPLGYHPLVFAWLLSANLDLTMGRCNFWRKPVKLVLIEPGLRMSLPNIWLSSSKPVLVGRGFDKSTCMGPSSPVDLRLPVGFLSGWLPGLSVPQRVFAFFLFFRPGACFQPSSCTCCC